MSHKSTPSPIWLLYLTTVAGLSMLINMRYFFDHRRARVTTSLPMKFETIWIRPLSNHLSTVTPEFASATESNAPWPSFFRSFSDNKRLSAPFSGSFQMVATERSSSLVLVWEAHPCRWCCTALFLFYANTEIGCLHLYLLHQRFQQHYFTLYFLHQNLLRLHFLFH